ncbi:MAG: DNA-protecting protein DprA [Ignavibacteriales bacterium]|nr:DNA-protecting protein DprA [Ignavibacteriales bacterium]
MSNDNFEKILFTRFLLCIEGIGPQRIISIANHIKTLDDLLSCPQSFLTKIEGISSNLSIRILSSRNNIAGVKDETQNELLRLQKINSRIITFWDDDYPELLKKIFYPPVIIYTNGNFSEPDKYSVAIVGTRQPTTYGKTQAEKFTSELVEKDITIVSGLARGIDSIAHETALKKGGRTIAVLGSGLNVIYPPENKKLFEQISEGGVVISEYSLDTKPDAQNFPRRNRIISGLSLGTLIVETKINGGAMQTAAYAIDQNREVFAVPGNLNTKQSEGPNSLIQKGEAKLVTNAEDIFDELNIKIKPQVGKTIPKPTVELNIFEEKLLTILTSDSSHIDDIASKSGLSISDCLVNLLTLEFKGLVKQLPGKMFTLAG